MKSITIYHKKGTYEATTSIQFVGDRIVFVAQGYDDPVWLPISEITIIGF